MHRKPPSGSVRRVRPIDNNYRFFFDGKQGEENQSESFEERIHALELERNPRVLRYKSQPERFDFVDEDKKNYHYTLDYRVWMVDGSVEDHEITLEERRQRISAQRREAAAARICAERGNSFHVFTEKNRNRTESVNLYSFYGFSAHCYCDQQVYDALLIELELGVKYKVQDVVEEFTSQFNIVPGIVVATIVHMIWHQKLNTDMKILFFLDGEPCKQAVIWHRD